MEMMLDKKQSQELSYKFKMGHKAVETTCNINNAFGPHLSGTANRQCSGGSGSFAKETRALKMRSIVASHQKLTTTNWEPSPKLILLQLHKNLPKTQCPSWSFSIWSKLERWKNSVSGCLMSWPQIKTIVFWKESPSLILCNNNKPFLNHTVMCEKKWILYDSWWWPAKWLDWEASKHFPKPNLHQKKVVCCRSHPLQHSESQRNHFIWIVCSANRWVASKTATPAAGIAQQKGPNSSA